MEFCESGIAKIRRSDENSSSEVALFFISLLKWTTLDDRNIWPQPRSNWIEDFSNPLHNFFKHMFPKLAGFQN